MPAPDEITVAQLMRLIGLPDTPVLLDVRSAEDIAADPRFLPASLRRDWRNVAAWADEFRGRRVVVACQRGRKLSQGVAAAVVGVIANLALWFGLRVLFSAVVPTQLGPLVLEWPAITSLDPLALALAALAAMALFRLNLGGVRTLALAAAAGLMLKLWLPA
jgi:hypothetical protein